MGKVLFPEAFRPIDTFCGVPDPTASAPDFQGWAPEQLWLSRQCWHRAAHSLMHSAVCDAVEAAIAAGTVAPGLDALLKTSLGHRRYAAGLRVSARILRGARCTATPVGRDLASCALVLAALRHDDLLAAIELAAEANGRALMLDGEADDRPLPPGILTLNQLGGRMRAQAREILSYRLSWPDLDTIGPDLSRALARDPVAAHLGYGAEADPGGRSPSSRLGGPV